jgi:hypothetical protein
MLAAACGGATGEGRAPTVIVRIATAGGDVVVRAEVAATSQDRQRGLMGRTAVPRGTGMYFLFAGVARVSFYMKDTLVPLDIALIRHERVVEVASMAPCRRDPCPLTTPAVGIDASLEVAAGGLASVAPGDRVLVQGALPSPS